VVKLPNGAPSSVSAGAAKKFELREFRSEFVCSEPPALRTLAR
jgi:hypothetical protein